MRAWVIRWFLVLGLALPGLAEESKVRKSLHMGFPNRPSGERFYELLVSRKVARLDLEALSRLEREKETELKELKAALMKQFGMNPTSNYRYEVDTRTLYQVKEEGSNLESIDAKAVRTFAGEDEAQDLLKRLTERRFIEMTLATLRMLEDQKERQARDLMKLLEDKYGLSPNQTYVYSAASNAVFKVEKAEE